MASKKSEPKATPAPAKKTAVAKAASVVTGKLERHPLSEKYGPKMADEELLGLGLDIKANGQHDEIIKYEGMVLAGWNRYMACLQQGVKPKTKEMEAGANPVAVAFGTNFMRRRLSSVQKAFFGAQFCIDTDAKQTEVAKMVGCNLNRLNQCCQLLRTESDEAKRVIETLRTNPEVTSGSYEEMMLEVGITRVSAPKPAATTGPTRTNTHGSDDFDDDDFLGGDLDDDLTGGAIDSLLSADNEPGTGLNPATRKPKEIGEGAEDIPAIGKKPGGALTNPHETPVSRVSKAFKALPPEEQVKFIKFSWAKLRVALDASIANGDVSYAPPETDGSEKPAAPAKPKGKAAKKAEADDILAGKNTIVDPSIIARPVKAEKPAPAAKKAPTPAKKAAAPAKKAPAKKAGKASK